MVQTSASCTEIADVAIDAAGDHVTLDRSLGQSVQADAKCVPRPGATGGDFGHIYLVPGRSTGAVVVRAGVNGKPTKDCTPAQPENCIFARRRFSYVDHVPLTMTVTLDPLCIGVPCTAESTCDRGKCIDSVVQCVGDTCATDPDASVPDADLPKAEAGLPDAVAVDASEDAGRSGAVLVAAGIDTTCAIVADGRIKCWGHNRYGQLGLGDTVDRGATAAQMGPALPAVDLGTGLRATHVCLGDAHVCALLSNKRVKCWGNNLLSQLGLGDSQDRGSAPGQMGDALLAVDLGGDVDALACGANHNCVLMGGRVKCWGEGAFQQLGVPRPPNQDTLIGDEPGEVRAAPFVEFLAPGSPLTAVSVHAGLVSSCARLSDGSLRCWGENRDGILGVGDMLSRGNDSSGMGGNLPPVMLGTASQVVDVSIGDFHACALLLGGVVKCWGGNTHGELGLGDLSFRGNTFETIGDNLPNVPLGGLVAGISASGFRACALRTDGKVVCWGPNEAGELGVGDMLSRAEQPAGQTVWPPALLEVDSSNELRAKQVAAGRFHTCVLFESGGIKCWGRGTAGALGLGDTQNRGTAPEQMGAALPFVALE